ncbi:MAG: SLC13 family permease [Dehalococcoidia bacterium]|nr:MAG: SLC13 family permease [Dehalococcoidia bacterium]
MVNFEIIACITILILAMVAFVSGKFRIDLVAIGILVTLLIFGLIDANQALSGFASQATGAIAAMFVISAGLVRTGAMHWLTHQIEKLSVRGERWLILILCAVVAVLSAFIMNTAVIAIFIPIAIVLAKGKKYSSSRLLMPMAFASQFGGVCTLVGTSTNMLISGIAVDYGMAPISFFEITPLGVITLIAGLVYLVTIGYWLIPKRPGELEKIDKYHLDDYLAEFLVTAKSSLIGKTWKQSNIERDIKVNLSNLLREDKAVSRPKTTKIKPGDLLLLQGNVKKLIDMQSKYGFELLKDVKVRDQHLNSHDLRINEVLIPPNSRLIGQTIQSSGYFYRAHSAILGLQRRGRVIKERLGDIKLVSGDTLLIQSHKEDLPSLLNSPNVIVTNELTHLHIRRDKALLSFLMMLLVIILVTFNILPLIAAVIIGAAGVILSRCLTLEEAYDAIDWKVIFLLGGIIPLGLALEQSGTALWIADSILKPLIQFGPIVTLAMVYLITAIMTEGLSNIATAVVMAPIAISLAIAMNVDPRPFLIAITFAASTSFATPVGYQTNTMIYSPGGYRFKDFLRVGGPLNLVFFGIAVLLIPVIWPL